MPSSYPLEWPPGWARTNSPRSSRFDDKKTLAQARDFVEEQLRLLRASNAVISCNVVWSERGQPEDKGVAVYFEIKERPQALACDRWDKVAHNLYAIGKHLEALRGQERWGVGNLQQAFAGYALPEGDPWWKVLGLSSTASAEEIRDAHKRGAQMLHPDVGGADEKMARLNLAREEGLRARSPSPSTGRN